MIKKILVKGDNFLKERFSTRLLKLLDAPTPPQGVVAALGPPAALGDMETPEGGEGRGAAAAISGCEGTPGGTKGRARRRRLPRARQEEEGDRKILDRGRG